MDTYVREFGHAKTHDEFFTNPEIQCKFGEYVQFLVSRYADEPGVIAWELANDARCSSTLDSSENCNANTVTKWHADTAKFVRKHDPNHLIASGSVPNTVAHGWPSNFVSHQDPRLLLSVVPQVIHTCVCAYSSTPAFTCSRKHS
jgi:endo-1,4-beta-mannosidase